MKRINFAGQDLCRWECGASTFLAFPEKGARLLNWHVRMADGQFRDVIHWPEDADFKHLGKVRGGNPILFPFAARSYAKGEENHWTDAHGVVRPMPRHGFAREGDFRLINTGALGFTAALEPSDADRAVYPYAYEFTVRYSFDELSMRVYLQLHNQDSQPIPWCAGHHFYFTLPWHPHLSREHYHYSIPAKACFLHGGKGKLHPVKYFETSGSLGHPELSDRIYTKIRDGAVTFGPAGGEENIRIRFLEDSDTVSNWNSVVTWREDETSRFYCIEPWMGPPSAHEHKKGLHWVEPGELAVFGVEVALL